LSARKLEQIGAWNHCSPASDRNICVRYSLSLANTINDGYGNFYEILFATQPTASIKETTGL
jgi:hypothetical protein